jgi:hypothetical protein
MIVGTHERGVGSVAPWAGSASVAAAPEPMRKRRVTSKNGPDLKNLTRRRYHAGFIKSSWQLFAAEKRRCPQEALLAKRWHLLHGDEASAVCRRFGLRMFRKQTATSRCDGSFRWPCTTLIR